MQDFKLIRQYFNASDALIAKEMLENENIRYFTTGENHTMLNPLIVPAIGGIRIMVHRDDYQRAEELLKVFESPSKDTNEDENE